MGDQVGPLDPNKIVAEFIQANLSNFLGVAIDVLSGVKSRVRLRLQGTYKKYLTNIIKRHSKAKSFFVRDKAVDLYEYYVPLSVATEQEKLDQPQIQDIVALSPFSIVTGTAGSGKSMFMRHLLISALKAKEKVPIFIELRELNKDLIDLREAIGSTLERNGFNLADAYIEKALEAGYFVLLLDGFDELEHDKHEQAKQEICSFAVKYNKNWVVVASRPDSYLEGLQDFTTLKIQPLDVEQACTLIEKLPSDVDIKDKFLEELRKDLFEKHESFLSNPLLLTIMLLTYGVNAEIPTKLNVFYNQAYEALFSRHDALKGGYKRNRHTTLDIQDYATAFSAFCLLTYDKRAFQFSEIEALGYIGKAKKLTRLDYENEGFLNDTLQSVCLMIEEGLSIVFAHRSFQEYFAARFIAEANPEVQKRLIKRYSQNVLSDRVLELLYEMRPDIVEGYYILPEIKRLKKRIGVNKKVGITHFLKYLKEMADNIILRDGRVYLSVNIPKQSCLDLIRFTLIVCGPLVGWEDFPPSSGNRMSEFLDGEETKTVDLSSLTYRSSFVKALAASSGGLCSLEMLCRILDIGKLLEKRQQETDASLEEILG